MKTVNLKKLSKRQARVEIAKDVIRSLRSKKYKPRTGSYIFAAFPGDSEDGDLQSLLPKAVKPCEVCALGACFLSTVKFANKYDAVLGDNGLNKILVNGSDTDILTNRLSEYFSEGMMALIEAAFERTEQPLSRKFVPGTYFLVGRDSDFSKAKKFGQRYKRDSSRMLAIMKNIVENEGFFKP